MMTPFDPSYVTHHFLIAQRFIGALHSGTHTTEMSTE